MWNEAGRTAPHRAQDVHTSFGPATKLRSDQLSRTVTCQYSTAESRLNSEGRVRWHAFGSRQCIRSDSLSEESSNYKLSRRGLSHGSSHQESDDTCFSTLFVGNACQHLPDERLNRKLAMYPLLTQCISRQVSTGTCRVCQAARCHLMEEVCSRLRRCPFNCWVADRRRHTCNTLVDDAWGLEDSLTLASKYAFSCCAGPFELPSS